MIENVGIAGTRRQGTSSQGFGFFQGTVLGPRNRKIEQGFGVVGIYAQSRLVAGQRLVVAAQMPQGQTQTAKGGRVAWRQGEGAAIAKFRRVQNLLVAEKN